MRPQLFVVALAASSASAAPAFGFGSSDSSSTSTSRFGNFFGGSSGGSTSGGSSFFGGGGSSFFGGGGSSFFGGGGLGGTRTTDAAAPPAATSTTTPGGNGGSSGGAQPGTSSCPSIEIISARGTTEPQSGSRGMAPIFSAITRSVSPLNANVYNVVYPASMNFATGPSTGAADVLKRIQSQSTKCPNQKFVLAGYSQGAMVITQSLSKITSYADRVAAVIMFGNPYYQPSSAAAAGTAKGSGGRKASFGGNTSLPSAFTAKTKDYCDSGDAVCQTGAFTITATHLGYGNKYASDAAAFVASKVK
ncbi:hypothetical protein HK097_008421 [Rhizophlyctis rosea]|uniref:Cutinase n=1 Tax=Rhizophlyctis rosea TaxID=64517 RepID=A0AAD5SCZ5_9FUNG|nr:hypothetical protein HK097_008421 [Rhizophlyctis rosea]